MRQIGISEKDDPLKRIQEEINEVARRERELREKMHPLEENNTTTIISCNQNGNQNDAKISILPSTEQISVSQDDNLSSSAASSLTTSVNSKEDHLDGHHSDDSGISASSSPVNGTSTNNNSNNNNIVINEKKYIRPNGYTSIPSPPPQKILTRTVSTPQIFTPSRRITFGPASKGLMQRFIATRGKIALNNAAAATAANGSGNVVGGGNGGVPNSHQPNTPSGPMVSDFPRAATYIPPVTITPPIIERDADGKPIRRGYIPVEEKIQKELKDLKSRESELKKIRKIRQSTPDLLDSIENEELESDEDSDVEHCYGPGKLRSAKSIGELCDSSNNSLSPRRRNRYRKRKAMALWPWPPSNKNLATPSPDFESKHLYSRSGMRPALSLAQLCDLDPQEAPSSSHQLIAKWESLIQQNA